jgi:ribosomal protein S18 acetylase RimI-like enzyme
MQKLIIRNAISKDMTSVTELLGGLGYVIQDINAFRKIWDEVQQNPSLGVLVAESDDQIYGYLAYSIKPQLRVLGCILEIDELSVRKESRGLGVGSSLMNAVKAIAIEKQVKRMVLSTNRTRESYQRNFYVKLGFDEKDSAWLKMDL